MWQLIDKQTGAVVGTYADAVRARRARDLAYGACRYVVRRAEGAQ